jgi:hypothetical protein
MYMPAQPSARPVALDSTAASALAWPAMSWAVTSGLRMGDLARLTGLRLSQLVDGRARILLRTLQSLWSTTAERLADPSVGLSALRLLDASKASSWP